MSTSNYKFRIYNTYYYHAFLQESTLTVAMSPHTICSRAKLFSILA